MPTPTDTHAPTPADIYDQRFVPALFQPWSREVAAAAALRSGQCVLDVACGTGVLASTAADWVGADGAVTGLDPNVQMLEVARRKPVAVRWVEGCAEALPFDAASFDAVVSQFGLMFFDDPVQALREMQRVLRPGGTLAVAVCDGLAQSPGYAALAQLLQRLFGARVADAFRAPFALGDRALLADLCLRAELPDAQIEPRHGAVRFSSIEELVATERACAWTLGGLLDDEQFERLLTAARVALKPYTTDHGVRFDMPALLITAHKR
jgi:SAM-dependent methyltransferase